MIICKALKQDNLDIQLRTDNNPRVNEMYVDHTRATFILCVIKHHSVCRANF